jgi:3-oxocholest-4-en-26-oyl-CoA dehydrogenase beta subunit
VDFNYNEEEEAVRELAGRVFSERATHERLKEVETQAGPEGPFDRQLWAELASTGLLGIGVGEDHGGAGLSFVAVALVAEAVGRTAAHVPAVETMVLGALPLDRFGTAAQRAAWLPKVVGGEAVLTAALAEQVDAVIADGGTSPATTATRDGDRWRLDGTKACVPAGLVADLVVIPASRISAAGERLGLGLFLVDPAAPGVERVRQDGPAVPEAVLELRSVLVDDDALLGGPDADQEQILQTLTDHAIAAWCVEEAGVCAASLALTADYAKSREQFGKPIATFQAVGQRAADAYVDTEAIRLTAWQGVWRLTEGLPATAELAVAKYWAAEGGQRVVHAAAHLHGGVGVDRDYPLHRFFLLTEQIEFTLGGARASLGRLGAVLAAEPV